MKSPPGNQLQPAEVPPVQNLLPGTPDAGDPAHGSGPAPSGQAATAAPPDEAAAIADDPVLSVSPDEVAASQSKAIRRVCVPAASFSLVFVLGVALFPHQFNDVVTAVQDSVVRSIGWYYVLLTSAFVAFCAYVGLSRWGDVRLGRDDEEPAYSTRSWFAMLFAAGMGIGLVFWGVAEPLNHLVSPPPGMDTSTPAAAASEAMSTTFLHWGFHAWGVYVVVGLAIALSVHRKGRPISIRWALEPLLGDRVKGALGDVIDAVAVISTVFGVASSLGLGAMQIGSGAAFLGLIPSGGNIVFLLLTVIVVAGMALLSAVSGLDRGIKILSNTNLVLAALLVAFVFAAGPSLFIAREFVADLGAYLQDFVSLSFRTFAYEGPEGEAWISSWTTFYWGWWIAWSPFVGIFIARISRGRTVREFVIGVLLVPTLIGVLWFSVLGGSAIYRQLFGPADLVRPDGTVDTNSALFALVETMPAAPVIAGLFILLIIIFFVTSADSGAFVMAMLSTGGEQDPPVWSRSFWAIGSGAIAAVLLWSGWNRGSLDEGLATIQTVTIVVAAPFSVIMVMLCVSIGRTLHWEHQRRLRQEARLFRQELHDDVVESVLADPATGTLNVIVPRQRRGSRLRVPFGRRAHGAPGSGPHSERFSGQHDGQ